MYKKCFVLCAGILILITMGSLFHRMSGINKEKIQESCVRAHIPGNTFHIHSHFEITQDKMPVILPANLGIREGCIHPLHTHDTSGTIHIDYTRYIPFTLGDFLMLQVLC